MRPSHLRFCVVLIAIAAITNSGEAEVIRLKNGMELHGEIIRFDAETGITFKRCENGGIIELRWEHLIEEDVIAIKAAHGYGDLEAEPIYVRAKKLLLATGDYVIGVQVESSHPGVVTLHRLGKNYDYVPSHIEDIENVEVEAQEVYTAQELYEQKIAESFPETALDHFKLAIYCESVTIYSRALEHYEMTAELDSEFKPNIVAAKIHRMGIKQSEKEATELLNEIRNRLYKKKFEPALKLCDTFARSFPQSQQLSDLDKLRSRIITKRHDYYQHKIMPDYFSWMGRIAYKMAADRSINLDDALSYARDKLGEDIKKKLAESYGMEMEEVADLWANRTGGMTRTATYGMGTFILGEQAKKIPEVLKEEDEEEDETVGKKRPATLDEKLKQRIEELKKEREKQVKNRRPRLNIENIGQTKDQWWRNADNDSRKQFLIAFFAENSDDICYRKVRLRPCATCCGKGWFFYFFRSEDAPTQEPCYVCKTLGVERIVVFK